MRTVKLLLVIVFGIAVVACGGGGGGGGNSNISTLAFPLLSGFNALTANGFSKSFTISGSCSGSGSLIKDPASTAVTFEGQPALSSAITESVTYSNCSPASQVYTGTYYYNSSNYSPLGGTAMGGIGFSSGYLDYGVFQAAPTLPASVHVGDTGHFGTATRWTNSTKTTANGTIDTNYAIWSDTASTAVVCFDSLMIDASNAPTHSLYECYRMTSTGALTLITARSHNFSSGSGLVMTPN